MKITVCVKPFGGEITPFDGAALETALRIPGAEVTVLCMARQDAAAVLEQTFRLGVSRAVLLCDPAFSGADTLATSYALSLAVKRLAPDLVLCGRQSVDGSTAQTGPALAEWLRLPLIPGAMEVCFTGNSVRCATRTGEETAKLPAIVAVERICTLRFPSLGSKAGRAELWSAEELGAEKALCGQAGSPTRVVRSFESRSGMRKCRFLRPEELEGVLAEALARPQVFPEQENSGEKLENVWTVGPLEAAKAVCSHPREIGRLPAEEIAAMAQRENPDAILWDSSPWSKRTAPRAAVLLRTGLCADCIRLEVQDGLLALYRPAFGGSVTAKIVCRTRPAMATVRTAEEKSGGVMLGLGAGAAPELPRLLALAEKRGWAVGVSRILVDRGLAPYAQQVGLTGRTVSPKVYLACGISGAVQHTCAIEQAGTVIAVNPDRGARIFDYADYGITADAAVAFQLHQRGDASAERNE